jgi:Xaa-Pro aminopeptidase
VEDIELLPYTETQDPLEILGRHLPTAPQVAISDQAWASVLLALQRQLPGSRFFPASGTTRTLRMIKSDEELSQLERAAKMVDTAFEKIVRSRFEGRSERDLAAELSSRLDEEGLSRANWGPIIGSGPNSASPHHSVTDRIMQKGDAVLLDFGGVLDGYQADTTRTVHIGQPSPEFRQAYEAVRQAQEAGIRAVRPGVEAQIVDRSAREVLVNAGLDEYFTHRTGHGIGLETHEEPYIVDGNSLELRPRMTFSVEPGVYFAGRFGVRIEDIVAVIDDGSKRLNDADRALIVVS